MHHRQEVVNVVLAQVLHERGLVAAPEQVLRERGEQAKLPDVLVDFQGLRLAVEAEFASTARADQKSYRKALERIEQGIAHIGLAVVYPPEMRDAPFDELRRLLGTSALRYSVVTEIDTEQVQEELFETPAAEPQFYSGLVADMADAIRRSYEQLVEDRTLARVVELLGSALIPLTNSIADHPGMFARIAEVIGVRDLSHSAGARSAKKSHARQVEAVCRIGALIVSNAMIFQEVLSSHDKRVRPLSTFRGRDDIVDAFTQHWKMILKDINYWPIFHAAYEVIRSLSSDASVQLAFDRITAVAMKIVACRAPLRHDLAGRIFHTLLSEAKYLGAYYTAIPSAALLLKLALRPDRTPLAWQDLRAVGRLRIADLACGTGTLLMAAADCVVDNHVRACAAAGKRPSLVACHRSLVENVLYGYDVLASAVHLTASTLSLRVPEEPINTAHLFRMDLGGQFAALGTLEFLDRSKVVATLFGQPEQVSARGPKAVDAVSIPQLDVCVMNPPFTRSVGGNLLFGNLPESERAPMQSRLAKLLRGRNANATAGLGAPFVLLGNEHVKPGGVLALVLPRALTSGIAWRSTRALIEENYDIEYLIVSHDPEQWNFSENTSLSEVLFVGRRRAEKKTTRKPAAVCVNLWRQPRTSTDSLTIAKVLSEQVPPLLDAGGPAQRIDLPGAQAGEAYCVSQSDLHKAGWGVFQAFAQAELARWVSGVFLGRSLPARKSRKPVPLTPLEKIARLGFDVRDLADSFEIAPGHTKYPAVWGHDTEHTHAMTTQPNKWMRPLAKPREGRPHRDHEVVWSGAGRLLIAERFRANTVRVVAMSARTRVLSNTWWTVSSHTPESEEGMTALLSLWLNSTPGLCVLLASRVETEGAWVKFKKPAIRDLPVPDIHALSAQSLRLLVKAHSELSDRDLRRVSEIEDDQTRIAIDEAISAAFALSDFSRLRSLLANEPIITLRRFG